jgi:hypothetical protein
MLAMKMKGRCYRNIRSILRKAAFPLTRRELVTGFAIEDQV